MTIVPTVIIGGFAGYNNVEYTVLSSGAIGLGITQFTKKVIKNWFKN